MELILVRHGLPERREDTSDPPLAPAGMDQARRVAAWLEHEGIHAVFASTMLRAVQTAEPFAALKQKGASRNLTQLRGLAKFRADKEPREHAQLLNQLVKAMEARDDFNKAIPRVMVMEDMKQPRDTFMLVRGAYNKPGEKTTAALPAALLTSVGDDVRSL